MGRALAEAPIVAAHRGLSDEEVVARVVAGEVALFELIMRRHNQRLFRVARAIVRDDEEAEDAVQEAHLAAYRSLGQFAGNARFSTWLTRIAIHEALRRARKRARPLPLAFEPRRARSPEEELLMHELVRLLEQEIDALPEVYRLVLVLREVQKLSVEETAHCLEITEENVKVRLHRAKAMLRAAVTAKMESAGGEAFEFLGARCDRIVERVLSRIL